MFIDFVANRFWRSSGAPMYSWMSAPNLEVSLRLERSDL